MFPNITQTLLLQTALQVLMESLCNLILLFPKSAKKFMNLLRPTASEIGSHTTCIINRQSHDTDHFREDRMEAPNVRIECDLGGLDTKEFDISQDFVRRLMWGINNGCAVRFLIFIRNIDDFK